MSTHKPTDQNREAPLIKPSTSSNRDATMAKQRLAVAAADREPYVA